MERPAVETIELTLGRMAARKMFPLSEIDRAAIAGSNHRLNSFIDHATRSLVMELHCDVLQREQNDEYHTEYDHLEFPADWWQHFRQRWFPRWWLSRWPVRMDRYVRAHETVIRRVRMCPHMDVPRNSDRHVRWMMAQEVPVEAGGGDT